jgi:hypothetical protein
VTFMMEIGGTYVRKSLDAKLMFSHGSSVSIMTRVRGSIPCRDWDIFSLPLHPDWLWGPSSHLSNGFRGILHRPGHEADRSTPSSAMLRMGGAVHPLPQYVFNGMDLN